MRQILLVFALVHGASAIAQDRFVVTPPRPVAGEPFVLELTGTASRSVPHFRQLATVAVVGSEITLGISLAPPGIGPVKFVVGDPDGTYFSRQTASVSAAGTYDVFKSLPGGVHERLATVTIDPPRPMATPASTNLSGNFFAPDEDGAGVNVIQGATGQVFAAWFTYDSLYEFGHFVTGLEPTWYVVSGGKWISPTEFQGVMYETYAAPVGGAYDPARFVAIPAGLMSMRFPDRNTLEIDAQLSSGIRKQKRLGRQQF